MNASQPANTAVDTTKEVIAAAWCLTYVAVAFAALTVAWYAVRATWAIAFAAFFTWLAILCAAFFTAWTTRCTTREALWYAVCTAWTAA